MPRLLDWLKALRIMRRYMVQNMDSAADRAQVAKAGGSLRVVQPSPSDALWQSCLRRCAVLPNRAEWDADAATLLIAATGSGVALPTVEEVES